MCRSLGGARGFSESLAVFKHPLKTCRLKYGMFDVAPRCQIERASFVADPCSGSRLLANLQNFNRPARTIVIENAYGQSSGDPRLRIQICPPFSYEWSVRIRVMPVYDVTGAVTKIRSRWVSSPQERFLVLSMQGSFRIDGGVDKNPVSIGVKERQVSHPL